VFWLRIILLRRIVQPFFASDWVRAEGEPRAAGAVPRQSRVTRLNAGLRRGLFAAASGFQPSPGSRFRCLKSSTTAVFTALPPIVRAGPSGGSTGTRASRHTARARPPDVTGVAWGYHADLMVKKA